MFFSSFWSRIRTINPHPLGLADYKLVVVLGAFGFLVFYSHCVAALIQNPDAIGRIVDDLRAAVELEDQSGAGDAPSKIGHLGSGQASVPDSAEVLSATSGYLQEIDHHRIVVAAVSGSANVAVPFRAGQCVLEGETLAVLSPASALNALAPTIHTAVTIGRHHVLKQDLEFGVAHLVEIGVRALSRRSMTPSPALLALIFWERLSPYRLDLGHAAAAGPILWACHG